MGAPSRFPNGISNAAPWQFFGGMGVENPFYYHQFADDFDEPPTSSGWVATQATGSSALAAGDGGVVLLSTTAVLNDFVSLQRPAVGFQPVASKKLFFVTRLALSDVAASAFVAGLMPITATPFTNPANGIWISKASGSSVINLNVANNSVVTTTPFPATAYTLANATSIDVGFVVTAGSGGGTGPTVQGAIAPNLVGYIPQSGTGAAGSTNRAPNIVSTAPVLTTLQATVLAPVVGVQAGAAAIKTMTVDYLGAFRER